MNSAYKDVEKDAMHSDAAQLSGPSHPEQQSLGRKAFEADTASLNAEVGAEGNADLQNPKKEAEKTEGKNKATKWVEFEKDGRYRPSRESTW